MEKRTLETTTFAENKKAKTLQDFLLYLYKNPLTTSNSIEGLYQTAIRNNINNFDITKEDIRLFLLSQPTYQTSLPISSLKQQKRTVVSNKNLKWQMDLIDLQLYTNENENVKYVRFSRIAIYICNPSALNPKLSKPYTLPNFQELLPN